MPTVAVIGTGFIGPVHVEALRRLTIPVKGILGSTASKSQEAAKALGLAVGYSSFNAVLADQDITVVHITSPNHLHLEQVSKALEAGKHVICEKPLAMDSHETSQLVALAKKHPEQISAVNYNVRFYPLLLHAQHIIRRGDLGTIYSITGSYSQDWLAKASDWNWRLEPDKGGQLRAMGDIGTHWMDLIAFLSGKKVVRLVADLETFIKQRKKPKAGVETFSAKLTEESGDFSLVDIQTEDFASVLFHYEGGARGVLNVSQVSAGRKNRLYLEIAGSKASLAWDSEIPNQLWLGHRDKANEILLKDPALMDPAVMPYSNYPGGHTEGFPDTFKQLYRAIYDYMEAADYRAPKPFPSFEDGHYEVLLCEKILQSHREQRWLDL